MLKSNANSSEINNLREKLDSLLENELIDQEILELSRKLDSFISKFYREGIASCECQEKSEPSARGWQGGWQGDGVADNIAYAK